MPGRLLFINFHYIRDPDQYPYPGIHPISLEAFRAKVEWLRERFHLSTPAEVEAFVLGRSPLARDSVCLTFDDGLVDHVVAAREVLNPLGISGAFFPSTMPLAERRILLVHKIHLLRASTEPNEFHREFLAALPEKYRSPLSPQDQASAQQTYPYDKPDVAALKFMMNFRLPREGLSAACDAMLASRAVDEAGICAEFYCDSEGIRQLHQGGHLIGAHGHTHAPFSGFDSEGADREVASSRQTLEEIVGEAPRWISYPHGSASAIPANCAAFCERFGYVMGITMLRGWNDDATNHAEMRRIDNADMPKVLGYDG